MKIIIVGATGTLGKYLTNTLNTEHEIIRVASNGAAIGVDNYTLISRYVLVLPKSTLQIKHI